MPRITLILFASFVTWFRFHLAMQMEFIALRIRLQSINRASLDPNFSHLIAGSGFGSPDYGPVHNRPWHSCNLIPSSPGRKSTSVLTGDDSVRAPSLAVRLSRKNYVS